MAFHACRGECRIDMVCGVIVRSLVEHEFVIRNTYLCARFKSDRHYDTLIVYERSVAATEIHDLVLVPVMASNNSVLAGNMVPLQADSIVSCPTDGGGVINFTFKWFSSGRSNTKLRRHFQSLRCHAGQLFASHNLAKVNRRTLCKPGTRLYWRWPKHAPGAIEFY